MRRALGLAAGLLGCAPSTGPTPTPTPFAGWTDPVAPVAPDLGRPDHVVAGRFDADACVDLLVAWPESGTVSAHPGRCDGTFEGPQTWAGLGPASGIALADLDGDGGADLVVAREDRDALWVRWAAAPDAPELLPLPGPALHALPVDGPEGRRLAATLHLDDAVSVFGLDGATASVPVGDEPSYLAVGDLDGDGDDEAVTTTFGSDEVVVLWGGAGPAEAWPAGREPAGVSIGDFDGDGARDLATANESGGDVTVLWGDGARGFVAEAVAVGDRPFFTAAADLDGRPGDELLVVLEGEDALVAWAWDGGWTEVARAATAAAPSHLAVADLDGDGTPDVAVTAYDAGAVEVFLNPGG